MKGDISRWIILLLALICVVQGASAFNVKTETVNPPSGDLEGGQAVTAHYVIVYSSQQMASDEAFDFSTGLQNPVWTFIVYRDGIPIYTTEKTGYYPSLGAFELTYTGKIELDVQLSGNVPKTSSGEVEIIKLEHTVNKNVLDNYRMLRTVVSAEQVKGSLSIQQQKLKDLKTDIDTRAAEGVNVTEAQAKYSSASQKLESAKSASPAKAAEYLDAATKTLGEARTLLDKAWAAKEVSDAGLVLDSLDEKIRYFTDDRAMGGDPRIVSVVMKRESAAQFYSQAKDSLSAKNYPLARSKAAECLNKTNEALEEVDGLQGNVGKWFSLNKDILLYAGIGIVIVLAIVGAVVYRKKKRWDELG